MKTKRISHIGVLVHDADAAARLWTGAFGFVLELFLAMGRVVAGVEPPGLPFMQWLVRGSGLVVVSLQVAVLAAFCWFILDAKVRRIERAEGAMREGDVAQHLGCETLVQVLVERQRSLQRYDRRTRVASEPQRPTEGA